GFGAEHAPLLVSVRAGATRALPNCLTTVLNVGLNEHSAKGLAEWADNEAFAWQVFLRAQQEFGQLVQEIDPFYYEEERDQTRYKFGIPPGEPLHLDGLRDLHKRFGALSAQWDTPAAIEDPYDQL